MLIIKTCSSSNNLVSGDKQLWIHIFNRDIKDRNLPSPHKSIWPISASTAQNVTEWVKNGIILGKTYLAGKNEAFVKFDLAMHVTWTKVVRGQWILAACSNLQPSKLFLWDIHSFPSQLSTATFHFSGPVTEALIEDDDSEILIAFTVGKKYVVYQPFAFA